MLKVGVIGIGNAGNQIANGIKELYPDVEAIAINSSGSDIAAVRHVETIILGDEKGAGKDRSIAKEFIKAEVKYLLTQKVFTNIIDNSDIIFLPVGSGGGTGSGQSPVLTDILKRRYPSKLFINIGILPSLNESPAAQQNTLDYLKELVGFGATYMLYDNDRRSNVSTSQMLTGINKVVIEDIIAIRGEYQYITPYTSIDDKDAMKIVGTPGRLMVSRAEFFHEKDLDEKSIEDRLLDDLNLGVHAEIDRDQIVKRMGIITNLNKKINDSFSHAVPKFKELVGEPVEGFEHVVINETEEADNRVIAIMAGMSMPDYRLQKIVQRIESVEEEMKRTKQSSVLQSANTDYLRELRGGNQSANSETENLDDLDIDGIFDNY